MVNPIKIGIVSGTDGILSIFVVEMASRVQKTFFSGCSHRSRLLAIQRKSVLAVKSHLVLWKETQFS